MELLFKAILGGIGDADETAAARGALIFAAWKKAAGEDLAGKTQPKDLLEGKLFIGVPDRTWMRILSDLAPQLLFKLNRILGEAASVNYLEFYVDASVQAAEVPASTSRENAKVDRTVRTSAKRIKDEALRKAFIGAAGNCLRRMAQQQDQNGR